MNEGHRDRLRKAVLDATGMTSPTAVWELYKKALGVGVDLFISNMNGNRDISKKAANSYAKAFGVTPGWLLYGESAGAEARRERSQLAEVSALAATLSEADAKALFEQLSARMSPATPAKLSGGRVPKSGAKAK